MAAEAWLGSNLLVQPPGADRRLLVEDARQQDQVGVPDAADQCDAKSLEIELRCQGVEDLDIAVVARAAGEMKHV